MKSCTKCKKPKPLNEFHNCASKPDGKFSACKDCRNKSNRERSERIGYDAIYARAKSSPGHKEKRAEAYQKNAEKIKERSREWKRENKEKASVARKEEYARNRDRYIARAKQWAESNQERRREIGANYSRRVNKNPAMKPALMARKLLHRVLFSTGRKKFGKTFSILGYNKDQFCHHIERQFVEGMSWCNHGEWHVDHIISVSEMIHLGVSDPAKINALSNLRPVWASDNLSKGAGFDLSAQVAP